MSVFSWFFWRVSKDEKSSRLLHRALLSGSPSVCMEQLASHWMNFREILYPELLLKSVEKIQVWLKLSNNIMHYIWSPKYIYDFCVFCTLHCDTIMQCQKSKLKRQFEKCAFRWFPLRGWIYDISPSSPWKESSFRQKSQRKSKHAFHTNYIFFKNGFAY